MPESKIIRQILVDKPDGSTLTAEFRKDLRTGGWRCIRADDPIEWFTRVRNMEIIHTWLFDNHFAFRWSIFSADKLLTRQQDSPGSVTRDEQGIPLQPIKLRWNGDHPRKPGQQPDEKKHMTAETVRLNHPQTATGNAPQEPMFEQRLPNSLPAASNAN